MNRLFASIATIFVSTASLFAQTDNVAPVVWERYKLSSKDVSLVFPKLPTMLSAHDACRQQEVVTYRAYAEGAAYELTISSSKKGSRPDWCNVPRNRFDRDALENRLGEIGKQTKLDAGTATKLAGLEAFRFTTAHATRVLVSDIDANKRWIELEVMHHADTAPDLERFFGSLQFGEAIGKEIGEGSKVTLGDEGTPVVQPVITIPAETRANAKSGPGTGSGTGSGSGSGSGPGDGTGTPLPASDRSATRYMLVAREKARYTDEARRANTQGTVALKVTLLANGAVGSIVVVKGLPNGLTENAQYAARRLVFLPKKVDGKPVSVVVTVEYSFSIY